MVTVDELLAELDRRGARLTVDPDGRLVTDAPTGAITDELADAIGAHRVEVLHRLGHPESALTRWDRAMTDADRAAAAVIRGHHEEPLRWVSRRGARRPAGVDHVDRGRDGPE